MPKRIVFTGGSGRIGRHVVPYLLSHGYQVLNLDRVPLDHANVPTVITDLAGSGGKTDPDLAHWMLRIIVSFLTDPGADEAEERRLLSRFLPQSTAVTVGR